MASYRRDLDERLRFVKLWANYVKDTPNKKWSRQQNVLINSVMKSANQDAYLYLKVKKLAEKRELSCKRKETPGWGSEAMFR